MNSYINTTTKANWRKLDSQFYIVREEELGPTTISKRAQLKSSLDSFCTFSWNGVDAFDNFGAFIINKDSLKFYNGPSYTNQYNNPMYTDAYASLTGIKFNIQKISFTVGVFWISEEHYRRFIHWLHPYEVGALVFDFQPMWNYNVKLAGIKDTTRTIIGHEADGPRYYTELVLDFEVQGEPCANYNVAYDFRSVGGENPSSHVIWGRAPTEGLKYRTYIPTFTSDTTGNIQTDLPTGFVVNIPVYLKAQSYSQVLNQSIPLNIKLYAEYEEPGHEAEAIQLFNVKLENLSFFFYPDTQRSELEPITPHFNLKYNAADGLLFISYGDSEEKLLTQLQVLGNGKRPVESFTAKQFKVPGKLDNPQFDIHNFHLCVEFDGPMLDYVDQTTLFQNSNSYITMYAKTNLI